MKWKLFKRRLAISTLLMNPVALSDQEARANYKQNVSVLLPLCTENTHTLVFFFFVFFPTAKGKPSENCEPWLDKQQQCTWRWKKWHLSTCPLTSCNLYNTKILNKNSFYMLRIFNFSQNFSLFCPKCTRSAKTYLMFASSLSPSIRLTLYLNSFIKPTVL